MKSIEQMNDVLDENACAMHVMASRLSKIEQALKMNGPDQVDPSRSKTTPNNAEAVDAASQQSGKPKKGKEPE